MTSKKRLKPIACGVLLIKSGYPSFSVQNSAISVLFMRELIILTLSDLGCNLIIVLSHVLNRQEETISAEETWVRYDHERSQFEKYPDLLIRTLGIVSFHISLVSEQDAETAM